MGRLDRRAAALSIGASLLILAAAPAFAQSATDATPANPLASSSTGSTTSQNGDIIVTAQRRTEKLRDVPISITALNSDALQKAGVTNTIDLARVSTNVEMSFYGSFIRPAIRGIATGLSSLGDSGDTALYIDGIYQPSASGQLADLPGVQSVQILKGPQGSLYGQNAAAGAIIVDTITPSFKTKGFLTAGYGNYNDKSVNGFVTGPLSSTIAVAVSGSWENRDGFSRDLLRGGHDKGLRSGQARGKLLWQPSPSVSFTAAAYYSDRKDTEVATGSPLNGNSVGNALAPFYPGLPFASKPHTFSMDTLPDNRVRDYGFSLLGKIGVGDIGTISTVTSYQNVKVFDASDLDESPIAIAVNYLPVSSHDFIQEVNFASNKLGRFTFSAGVFFMSRQETYDGQVTYVYNSGSPYPNPPGPALFTIGSYTKNKKQSYAGYVEGNYDITDTLTLTAAGRYSYERQKAFNSAYPDPAAYPDPRGYFHFSKFTPRAVLRWKPNSDNTLYFSYSQGFKSGLVDYSSLYACYNPVTGKAFQCGSLVAPVKPETVTAYEVGYKGRLSASVNLTLAAFHYDYKDIQVFIYNPLTGGSSTQNAAAGRINGVEFEGNFKVSHDLTLNLSAAYLNAKYSDFKDAAVYLANPPSSGGNTEITHNETGKRLPYAPDWTANASIDYRHEFAAGTFELNVNGNYSGKFFFDANNRVEQHPYALLNTEISFAPTGVPGLRLVLWGKNLTNHDYLQGVVETPFADDAAWAPPRTFGGRAEFKF